MKKSIVSVILPIYNVEQYLAKCLDSVINQTYKDLEIICVNDCSPDNSTKIIDEYASKDKRIKIVNRKENGGLSAARNSGLNAATGEYIYFLDSDDWIDLDYIEKMVEAIEKAGTEVVVNTNIIQHQAGVPDTQFYPDRTIDFIENTYADAQKSVLVLVWNTWAHLWKKSFLDRIEASFPEGYIIEDMYFQATTFAHLDKIYITRDSAYHYTVRENSICGNLGKKQEFPNCFLKIYNKIADYYIEHDLLDKIHVRICPFHAFVDFKIFKLRYQLEYIRNYFEKVKVLFENNKSRYKHSELEYFNNILYNFEDTLQKGLNQSDILSNIRKQMLSKAGKSGK